MKKIYFSLVAILLVATYAYGQSLLVPYNDISNDILNKEINVQNLRSTADVLAPDSAITYNADGSYSSKTVTKYPGLFNGYQVNDVTFYIWNTDLNKWQPSVSQARLITANDERGRILQEVYKWDEATQAYVINDYLSSYNYRIKTTYNSQKLLTRTERTIWNKHLSDWILDSKVEILYDNSGQTMAATSYQWGDFNGDGLFEWELIQNQYYSYDINSIGQTKKASVYYYSPDSILVRGTRSEYVHDTIGNVIKKENIEYAQGDSIWRNVQKYQYSYNPNNQLIQEEYYGWNTMENEWAPSRKIQYGYQNTTDKTLSSQIIYQWDYPSQEWIVNSGYEYIQNESGRTQIDYMPNEANILTRTHKYSFSFNSNIGKDYTWNGTEWVLIEYTIHYPLNEEEDQNVEVEETQPVSEDNKGKFELTLTLPTEATVTGSFILEFPEGITLDQENTILSPELANQFDLIFTPLENNKWKIEIVKKQSSFRSALSEVTYKKILDVAYTVSENITSGNKTIEVKDLSLEKSTGGTIEQESAQVNVGVRNGLNIKDNTQTSFNAYTSGDELIIRSQDSIRGFIYSASGVAISKFEKESQNDLIINISALPLGVYVIKSDTGSVTKFLKK